MSTAPSLSQKQMGQIMSAGSGSYKQIALQPNAIPLSHGKVMRHRQLFSGSICILDNTPLPIALAQVAPPLHLPAVVESLVEISFQRNNSCTSAYAGCRSAVAVWV